MVGLLAVLDLQKAPNHYPLKFHPAQNQSEI